MAQQRSNPLIELEELLKALLPRELNTVTKIEFDRVDCSCNPERLLVFVGMANGRSSPPKASRPFSNPGLVR